MPFQRNRTKSNLVKASGDTISIDSLDIGADEDLGENLGNLNLKPRSVNSIKTTNQKDTSSLGSDDQYILLVGQTDTSQNGLYKQQPGGAVKVDTELEDKNHYFVDTAGIRAIFIDEVNRFKRVYIDNIHLYDTFTTSATTQKEVFDILVKTDSVATLDIEVIGIKTDGDDIFHGTYKRTFYNNSVTYKDGGDHIEFAKTKGTFATPTIAFDLNNRKLKITPGDTETTTWVIKGKLSM